MAELGMKTWLHIIGVCALVACAQVRNPQGGPRDQQGPILVEAVPMPMSTNFQGSRIELEFDEYVELVGVRDQVLISPPLEKMPEITLRGNKRVIIDFGDQALESDRTYTIQFGEAIVDYTERNPLEANTFLFPPGIILIRLNSVVKSSMRDIWSPCKKVSSCSFH